ncbi:hypothetical protein AB0J35_03815 [Nonomuraea angiospora]|uniref:hypothetical protein n=1 Tax=Nonomuraea angiospora TaxID=46172 RepID=UPI003443040B
MFQRSFDMRYDDKRGFGRRDGCITVIENNVLYSYRRTAKITFYVTLAIVGLFAAVISTYYLPPIAAVPVGLVAGTIIGGLIASVIAIWPVLRAIWWWLPELSLVLSLIGIWAYLQDQTNPIITGIVYATIITTVGLIPAVRHYTLALLWCLIVRHRLRTCFNAFLPADRHGHLPFIGLAKPILAGERVWVWLRPGLSLEQIEHRLDRIAVACWAASVTVTKARTSNAATIYLDIKRRDVQGGMAGSPLTDDLPTDIPARSRPVDTVPTQLDLADVPDLDNTGHPAKKNGRCPVANGAPANTVNPDLDWI